MLALRYESLGSEPIVEEAEAPATYWALIGEQAELIGKLRLTPDQLEAENGWVEFQPLDRDEVEAEWLEGATEALASDLDEGVDPGEQRETEDVALGAQAAAVAFWRVERVLDDLVRARVA